MSAPLEPWNNHHVWMASKPPVPLKICNWSWIVTNHLLPGEDFSPLRQVSAGGGVRHTWAIWHSGRCHTTTQSPSRAGDSSLEGPPCESWRQDNTCCVFFYFRFRWVKVYGTRGHAYRGILGILFKVSFVFNLWSYQCKKLNPFQQSFSIVFISGKQLTFLVIILFISCF